MRAAEAFARGESVAQISRELGVSDRAVRKWKKAFSHGGRGGLRSKGPPGPSRLLSDEQLEAWKGMLREGPQRHGYATNLWTLGRVRQVVEKEFGVRYSEVRIWKLLRSFGWTPQKPEKRAREGDREKIDQWKRERWPQLRDEAAAQGRTIVFVDESGLSQKPARKRTWAPRGETPILEFHFHWKTLSAIAGVSFRSFYFSLQEGTIKSAEVIEFVRQLQQRIRGPLLLIWDGLAAHRSAQVRAFLESTQGAVVVERLPAYAPEWNPVEYLWGHLKNHQLSHFAPETLAHLAAFVRRALRRTQKRPSIISAFWVQAELPWT
ncbi:hypothetical protein MAMC_01822 [Methylacidimicrobium cyclopophantes]|uniref:IS630 family transposase n=2 Tax=Methylacidimicrobium cyclopophantes TaxID=1041766 RepID=A0A5E6MIL2_9BACT|nr:hypothetical protein MAMC_01822 [Methylacidimicrobium cyclopophantes]